MFFLDFQTKNWTKCLVTLTVCKLWGGLCIIFTGQLASKADEFRLNRQKSPKARAHSGERAPKLKVKLTTQFRQPHLSALIAHSRLEFSLNHLVLSILGFVVKYIFAYHYTRHPRFVCFLSHFSLRFVLKSSLYFRRFMY